jgi:hypothetical protein
LCEASVKRGTEYRNTVQKEYCTFVLTWHEITDTKKSATAKDW